VLRSSNGHVEIVKFCKEWGVTDFGRAMDYAAYDNGNAKFLKERGITFNDRVLRLRVTALF